MTAEGPQGPITIHPADYYRRLPAYEAWARMRGWPVGAVWLVLHEINHAALRGATGVTRIVEGVPEYTICLNVSRTQCVLHRIGTFAHEGAHIARGDCLNAKGYSRAQEDACDDAAVLDVRAAVGMVRRNPHGERVDEQVCVQCFRDGQSPCPQSPEVFSVVNRTLADL